MKLYELKKLCEWWQTVLRLEDFDVHVRFAQRLEIEGFAETQRSTDGTYALIIVMPDSLRTGDTYGNQDEETNLVHELLHVREIWDAEPTWRELKKNNATLYRQHEMGIQRTAEALVALKRREWKL
jgi:hypothetical protein